MQPRIMILSIDLVMDNANLVKIDGIGFKDEENTRVPGGKHLACLYWFYRILLILQWLSQKLSYNFIRRSNAMHLITQF